MALIKRCDLFAGNTSTTNRNEMRGQGVDPKPTYHALGPRHARMDGVVSKPKGMPGSPPSSPAARVDVLLPFQGTVK